MSAKTGMFAKFMPFAFLVWALGLWNLYYGDIRHGAAFVAFGAYGLSILALTAAAAAVAGLLVFLEKRGALRVRWRLVQMLAFAIFMALGALVPWMRDKISTILLAALLATAALALGSTLLGALRVRTRGVAEELAWGGALGLGGLSFAFTVLGMFGLFRPWAFVVVMCAALVWGLRSRRLAALGARVGRESSRVWRRAGTVGGTLLLLMLALAAWRAAHCFTAPGLGEADYDALEYHLAAPLEWLASGRIDFLPHNTYANMPAGAEMLYAPGLGRLPGFLQGYHFAKLVGVLATLFATLAVCAAGRRLGGRRAGGIAAAVFFSGTWLSELLNAPFVEPLLLLYATVAWSALAAWASGRGRKWSLVILAGLCAGFAAATKYPAAVFVAAPLGAAALAVGVMNGIRTRPLAPALLRALAAAALVGTLSLAMAAPWYARNWLADGNPVYPLASNAFPSRHWDAERDARWRKAHTPHESAVAATTKVITGQPLPKASDGSPNLASPEAWHNLFTSPLIVLLVPLAPLAVWRCRRRALMAATLAVGAVAIISGWALLTHQIERFLWPAYGCLAALGAAGAAAVGKSRLARAAVLGAVLVWVVFSVPAAFLWTRMAAGDPPQLGAEARLYPAMKEANSLPPDSKLLLVGEARAALFRIPVVYATVFDVNPLEEALALSTTPAEVAENLRDLGITHVYYDWYELDRLRHRSPGYSITRPDGTVRPPCFALPPEKFRLLDEFERDWLKPYLMDQCQLKNPLTGRRLLGPQELWELRAAPAPQPGK